MDLNFIITLLGTIFGLIGIFIAYYQNNQKKRIEKTIRAMNWFNYERTNVTNGLTQELLKIYKTKYKNNTDLEIVEYLSKIDAFGQEIYMAAIRQIQMFEPSFIEEDFQRWYKEGKITEEKKKLFNKFSIIDNHKLK